MIIQEGGCYEIQELIVYKNIQKALNELSALSKADIPRISYNVYYCFSNQTINSSIFYGM